MTWEQVVGQFGLPLTMAGWFAWREIWPFLRDRLFPQWAERRKAAEEKATNEREAQLKADREEREAQRAADREMMNRLFQVIDQNSAAYAALKITLEVTLGHVVTQLTQQTDLLGDMNEDVSGLYAHIGKRRPSREKEKVAQGG